jgi:hypothetical protein
MDPTSDLDVVVKRKILTLLGSDTWLSLRDKMEHVLEYQPLAKFCGKFVPITEINPTE